MAGEARFSGYSSGEGDFFARAALLVAQAESRPALTSHARDAVFRLRYQAYARAGAIAADSSMAFTDTFDATGDVYLLGLYLGAQLAGSIRLHVVSDTKRISPALAVFPDLLQPELDAGKVMVDCSHIVADGTLARLYRELPYATHRLGVLAAEHFNADLLVVAAEPGHRAFYQRAFNYRPRSEPGPNPRFAQPATLMMLNFPPAAAKLKQRYPFFRSTCGERNRLFARLADNHAADGVTSNVSSTGSIRPTRWASHLSH
jgi:hypothetical protein